MITKPDWLRQAHRRTTSPATIPIAPSGWASAARPSSLHGAVQRHAHDCSVVSEDPADQDFGDAALKLSKLFKMRPQSKDGVPTGGGTVRIPIRFQIAKG